MVESWWLDLPERFPDTALDAYVIMPNHLHGILLLSRADTSVGPYGGFREGDRSEIPLTTVVQWFKTQTTNAYIRGVRDGGWPPFAGRLWQRSYYEHVIRNEDDANRIRRYIAENPARWHADEENPQRLDADA